MNDKESVKRRGVRKRRKGKRRQRREMGGKRKNGKSRESRVGTEGIRKQGNTYGKEK